MKCDDPFRDRSRSHSQPVDRPRTVLPARSAEWLSQAHGRTSVEFARGPSSAVALRSFSDRPAWASKGSKIQRPHRISSFDFCVLGLSLAPVGSRSRARELDKAVIFSAEGARRDALRRPMPNLIWCLYQ